MKRAHNQMKREHEGDCGTNLVLHVRQYWRSIAVHLAFANFIQGSPAENLTTVHLGFSNFIYGCRACRQGVLNKVAA